MRVTKDNLELDYENTEKFFNNRANHFKDNNPYSVTMYQDNNPTLVEERNKIETSKIIPKLKLDSDSKILDVACGIARWSDAIETEIDCYCGIDFCDGLIEIAKDRNKELADRSFLVGNIVDSAEHIKKAKKGKFNRFLVIGALIYINDEDVKKMLDGLMEVSEDKAILCIREPIGLIDRLTLKDFYSDELKDNYNAIYRTRDELQSIFNETIIKAGFRIVENDYLFKESHLNNRKETEQYYWLFER